MKNCTGFIFLFLVSFYTTFGQKTALNKVLIFSKPSSVSLATNRNAMDVFYKTSLAHRTKIDTTSNPAFFTEEHLKNYHCIVFLNTSVNALNYRQIAEFQRFMQANGGFVGIHSAADFNYSSVWYKSLIAATVEKEVAENTQYSIITNANLGKTEVSPFWKLTDKPLVFNSIDTKCKPVLLDVNGKTWAWHYTTDEGGKMFYTAFGAEAAAYNNPDFIAHLWAGIEEVSAKQLPDFSKVAASALPQESYFLKQVLVSSLNNPSAFVTLPDGNCLIAQQDGSIFLFQNDSRKLQLLNKIEGISTIKKMKLDPEFAQNGYVYTFHENANEWSVKRLQLSGNSNITLTDFSGNSTAASANTAKYSYAQAEPQPYRFPKYYDGKTFRFDTKEGFIVETFDEDGKLKDREPFLPNQTFKNAEGLDFGKDGALYFLEGNDLVKIDYSEKNRPPVAILKADVLEGAPPLKVHFSAVDSYDLNKDELSFSWQFDDKTTSSAIESDFTFTKIGIYTVKLQVTDKQGLSDTKSIQITVERKTKPSVKPRRN